MKFSNLCAGRLVTTFLLCATFIFSTIAFAVPSAHASPVMASGSIATTRYAPTTSAMKIVTGNVNTTTVIVVNIGSVAAYLGTTSSVTASSAASTDGAPLLAGNTVKYSNMTNNLYAITASGTAELRVTIASGGASVDYTRLSTTGIANGAANTTVMCSDGTNAIACTPLIYNVTTAITANFTSTATAAGTFAITSNATGRGLLFVSDASLWQLATNQIGSASSTSVTTATTSTSDVYLQAPFAGTLTGVDFTSIDALAASDTNYITWTLVNLGQSGVGTTAMIAVDNLNTTKATGGTAITAVAKHALVIHGTSANLIVAKGDVLRLRATVTGTLVGTVTGSRCVAHFTRLS